jgi:glycosyltransferase involved in cell wall biosynthesis
MKIFFVISEMSAGGAERQAALICNHWAQKGHDVTLATFRGLSSHYELHPAIRRLEIKRSLRSLLRQNPPEVIVSFMDTVNVKVLLASWRLSIPVIVSERSVPAALYEMNSFFRSAIFGLLRRLLYRCADVLVVQTHAALPWGRNIARRTEVIGNAVAIESIPVAERDMVILSVGRLTKEKGHAVLLDAFSKVAACFPAWRVLILGEGPLRADLERRSADLGISSRIDMPGIRADLTRDYSKAGLFVLPSFFEGFPNALIEAMQAGCAVIASDCPFAPPEIINDGVNGMLFSSGDSDALARRLAESMQNKDLRDRLGGAAARKAEAYRPEKILSLWDALLIGLKS